MNSFPNLEASDLRPGDVCLMMSRGELSKLISWVGDSPYSHAFLMYDQHQLLEAALSGIRLYPIAQRMADVAEVLLIDVYRPSTVSGHPFGPAETSAMQTKAQNYVGRPYAKNALVEIALMSAMRNMVPNSETMRWVLRVAMSHFQKDDPSQMVCSELVYRVLQEAGTVPAGSLRPTIISAFRSHAALPPISLPGLVDELKQIFKPAPKSSGPGDQVQSSTAGAEAAFHNQEPVGAELEEMSQAIRAKHTVPQKSAPVLVIPDPNPKTVFPVDLATSPSLRFVGRLATPKA